MYIKPIRDYSAPFYLNKNKLYKVIDNHPSLISFLVIADDGHEQWIDDRNCTIFNAMPDVTLTQFQQKGGY